VATEIASRLGVEVEWETPEWTAITSGGWSDRWDMSVGSMTVTPERAEVLDFTPAYYYTPASVAVPTTATGHRRTSTGRHRGLRGCTYDLFLQGTLEIPGTPSTHHHDPRSRPTTRTRRRSGAGTAR
jgi:polar amino acid transport system substrate-binding protein